MATLKNPLTSLFNLQTLLLLTLIPTARSHSKSTIFHQNDVELIGPVCKRTPNYNLCVHYLKSDPHSSEADIAGLALIMVRVMEAKAKETLVKINILRRKSHDYEQKKALMGCKSRYRAIVEGDCDVAKAALPGNPKFAENGVADAIVEANGCEKNVFPGIRCLQKRNKAMSDVAGVARAIIRYLL